MRELLVGTIIHETRVCAQASPSPHVTINV